MNAMIANKQNKIRIAKKAIASAIAAALLITAPGLPCYQAFAFRMAPGKVKVNTNIRHMERIGQAGNVVAPTPFLNLGVGVMGNDISFHGSLVETNPTAGVVSKDAVVSARKDIAVSPKAVAIVGKTRGERKITTVARLANLADDIAISPSKNAGAMKKGLTGMSAALHRFWDRGREEQAATVLPVAEADTVASIHQELKPASLRRAEETGERVGQEVPNPERESAKGRERGRSNPFARLAYGALAFLGATFGMPTTAAWAAPDAGVSAVHQAGGDVVLLAGVLLVAFLVIRSARKDRKRVAPISAAGEVKPLVLPRESYNAWLRAKAYSGFSYSLFQVGATQGRTSYVLLASEPDEPGVKRSNEASREAALQLSDLADVFLSESPASADLTSGGGLAGKPSAIEWLSRNRWLVIDGIARLMPIASIFLLMILGVDFSTFLTVGVIMTIISYVVFPNIKTSFFTPTQDAEIRGSLLERRDTTAKNRRILYGLSRIFAGEQPAELTALVLPNRQAYDLTTRLQRDYGAAKIDLRNLKPGPFTGKKQQN
ncbi:MAG: hypothetical protein COB53_08115 [Elusimicrobia bacterium]|nr:MAG: hypothetical protein COB53_08115 [Elusimicrobiota bacterium]